MAEWRGIQGGSRWWWNSVCGVPGEDGMFHLAFWVGEGGVVEVVVVGVRRIVELDKRLGREQGIMVVDGKGGGFVVE